MDWDTIRIICNNVTKYMYDWKIAMFQARVARGA